MKIQGKDQIIIKRNALGVPKVTIQNEIDLYFGMGYCHAMDRGIQMMLMRILGQGTGSEHLDSSDEFLEIDSFFRQMNWSNNIDSEIEKFSDLEKKKLFEPNEIQNIQVNLALLCLIIQLSKLHY